VVKTYKLTKETIACLKKRRTLNELKPNKTYIFTVGDKEHEPTNEIVKALGDVLKKAIKNDKKLRGKTHFILIPYWVQPTEMKKVMK